LRRRPGHAISKSDEPSAGSAKDAKKDFPYA
jgi:hypothetical protein